MARLRCPSVTSLYDAVHAAAKALANAGVENANADAVALASQLLGVGRSEVQRLMILGAEAPEGLGDIVAERGRRVPLQHLTGKAGFRGLELSVGPGVFVPRPETELAAGLAITAARRILSTEDRASGAAGSSRAQPPGLQDVSLDRTPRFAGAARAQPPGLRGGMGAPGGPYGVVVVDLCTGSGAIALSVKDEVPDAQVYAVELSELAYAWAARNRDDLSLDVDLRLGDATLAFPDLEGEVDIVVSNPPYIPVGAVPNDPEVREHDPAIALYGGSDDGLRIPLAVAARAAELLRPGGRLVMEHADVQGQSIVAGLARTRSWTAIEDHVDLTGRPRCVTATRA